MTDRDAVRQNDRECALDKARKELSKANQANAEVWHSPIPNDLLQKMNSTDENGILEICAKEEYKALCCGRQLNLQRLPAVRELCKLHTRH